MRHAIVFLTAFLLIGCAAVTSTPRPGDTAALGVPADYALVWADEFSVDGLPDTTKWAYDTGMNKAGWHNRELQYYSSARAENAEVRDGRLIIHARKEPMPQAADWGGQRYTSSRLYTRGKADWTYGFFEIRAKLPCGKGSWPAIWMLNSPVVWPAGGELDIMEHVGRQPGRVFSTVHTQAAHGTGSGNAAQVPDACTAFHNYQMHWTAKEIRFGIDGKVHFVYPNPGTGADRWPFDAAQFLILNIAVGGDFGGEVDDTIFPVRMEVDYVRIYQRAPVAQPAFAWPHGARAAVSLAYDDALDSQLDTAIPALDKAGLKASFYLTLGSPVVTRRLAEWRAAAARGHELGKHTLFHQCSRSGPDRSWVAPENDLDKIDAAQLVAQIRVGNTLLHAIDGRRERTFTTPCGDLRAGGVDYQGLIKPDFVAIKSLAGGVVPDMASLDAYAVGVAVPINATGAQLIAWVQQAAREGTMANITFHGIGGDHLSVSRQAHEELLNHLAAHRDIYWTDTFINIMQHVKARQAAHPSATSTALSLPPRN